MMTKLFGNLTDEIKNDNYFLCMIRTEWVEQWAFLAVRLWSTYRRGQVGKVSWRFGANIFKKSLCLPSQTDLCSLSSWQPHSRSVFCTQVGYSIHSLSPTTCPLHQAHYFQIYIMFSTSIICVLFFFLPALLNIWRWTQVLKIKRVMDLMLNFRRAGHYHKI